MDMPRRDLSRKRFARRAGKVVGERERRNSPRRPFHSVSTLTPDSTPDSPDSPENPRLTVLMSQPLNR